MIYRRKKNQKIEFCSESNAQNSKASHQNHINPQKNTSNSPELNNSAPNSRKDGNLITDEKTKNEQNHTNHQEKKHFENNEEEIILWHGRCRFPRRQAHDAKRI